MASRVPPAVIKTFFPSRSDLISAKLETSEIIRETSGYRPTPKSSPVIRPSSGSITKIPRDLSVAIFSWFATLNHISGCIAGTRTIGQLAALTTFVNRSSAIPPDIFAMRSAVAGAITIRFAWRALFI